MKTMIAGIPVAGIALYSLASTTGGYGGVEAWSPSRQSSSTSRRTASSSTVTRPRRRDTTATALHSSTEIDTDALNLTPELEMMTGAFSSIADEKTRHKQLLYMANQLPTVDDSIRIPENKVPGCLSTVHVDCTTEEKDGDTLVNYVGDSDGLLTKGLLALLIRGLSGCTAEQIAAVDPQFIQAAKISQTLTPGRNNGFLNMLAVMKKKASDAVEGGDESPASGDAAGAENSGEVVTSFDEVEGKPMYNAILSTLVPILKPVSIELVDNSSQHAGHGGAKGWEESGESHFALDVVADVFDGLPLVKRHQLIYMLLGEVMPKIHALEIRAKSPGEI
mmetsp:Transcript_30572/g.69056  ORF Transcript_30572/g.69056 Transcript_30572/m.69056 type:complete len:335 (-) Transcript_30572:40-1044(-)